MPRAKLHAWWLALRVRTLTAAVAPVAVGVGVALGRDVFALGPALGALAGALWIQIGTNFANDYFDFVQGADTASRVGPTRAVAAGLLTPREMQWGIAAAFGVAMAFGVYLVTVGGWPIVAIGLASIVSGIGYTAGRKSLGYLGLGDIFVFVFFGLIAVAGTFYVQAGTWSADALTSGVPMGCLAAAILAVNNHRDAETDRQAGKKTVAVRFGRAFTRTEYCLMLALAYAVPLVQWLTGRGPVWLLLPWLTLPLALPPLRAILAAPDPARLNPALGATARLLAVFGLLYAVGWAVV